MSVYNVTHRLQDLGGNTGNIQVICPAETK